MGFGGIGYYYVKNYKKEAKEIENVNKGRAALAVGIIALLFALIFLCFVCIGMDKLKMAIEIINTSADFLASTKRLLIVPFIYYGFMFAFFLFWLGSIISVESLGKISPDLSSPYIPLKKKITWDDRKDLGKQVNLMLAFLIFALIWFTFFLTASNNYITMVTASTFYFNSSKENWGTGDLSRAFSWAWIHNFGSIAFGSLIIAVVWTLKMLVYYIAKKAEKTTGDNQVVKSIICMAQCYLSYLEEVVEYMNKAAYAYMAISGKGFCKSAINGLLLQFNHGAAFAFANLLAQMFMLLGKFGLTVLNVVITYYYIKYTTEIEDFVTPYGPLFIVALSSFLLVSIFLGMFDESVIAMMTCLCADLDLHGGRNKWGPEQLHKVIEKINGESW